MKNVNTKRKRIARCPALLIAAALVLGCLRVDARVELQPCKNNVSPEQQIQLGDKAAAQVYKQMPVLPDTSPETRYVAKLGQKLAAEAPGYKWPYNFHVVNVADVNAFALPGGGIFVNLGTIQAAANEAQLAAVMAHEISHVVLQHSVCNAEKEKKVGIMAGIGAIAAGVLLGDAGGQLAQEGIGLTAGLGFLKMSRGAEQQADLMGVGILYDDGYDPHAMAQFFETLQQKYGNGSAQFLSDHPNPGNRTEYVDREAGGFVPKAHYVTNTPEFTRIHEEVAGMRAYTAKEVAAGVWKRQDPNQTVSAGVNQLGRTNSSAGGWQTFQGTGFSMQVPGNWQIIGNADAAMLAPAGGITDAGDGRAGSLVEGILTDVYRPGSSLPLDRGFDALVTQISRDNAGLRAGQAMAITIGGAPGRSVEAENLSANGGRGEHDWIVAFQTGQALRYLVLVAPSAQFGAMKPTFDTILQSVSR